MAKITIEESILFNIGDAIRQKLQGGTLYKPSQMASAIGDIETYPEPIGTITITKNGEVNVKNYALANVDVQNSYSASDEGKVVSSGELVSQTSKNITQNGTYDTTLNDEIVVNVAGGSGGMAIDPYHTYYNGYLLPTIPEISGYPYVFIRKNTQTGNFDAIYGKSVWYSRDDSNEDNWSLITSTMPDYKWYTCPIQNAENSEWVENSGTNFGSIGTSSKRDIIWTNEDILYRSPTATEVVLIKGFPISNYIVGGNSKGALVSPVFSGLASAYISATGNFYQNVNSNNCLNFYAVESGKTYAIFLPENVSNRFRAQFYANKSFSDFEQYLYTTISTATQIYTCTYNITGSAEITDMSKRFLYTPNSDGIIIVGTSSESIVVPAYCVNLDDAIISAN